MTRNDLTNRLLNAAIVASAILAVALYAYYEWQPTDPGPPETEMLVPGPVAPQPKIEDHVVAVMNGNATGPGQYLKTDGSGALITFTVEDEILALASIPPPDADGYVYAKGKDGVWQYIDPPSCPTYDTLKRAGVEIVCTNAFGEVPSVNYWPVEVGMACSRIKEVRITNDKIKVIGGNR